MSPHSIEKEFEPLFSLLPVAAIIVNLGDGRIIEANQEAESLFGLPHDRIIGLTPADISPEFQPNGQRSEDIVNEKVAAVAQRGAETFFWWHKHLSGEQIPCLVQTSKLPVLGKDLFIGFVTKIDKQKEVYQELLNYRHIVEVIDNPIAIVTNDYRYRYVNPAYENLFRKSAHDIVGRTVSEIIGSSSFERIAKEKYDRCLAGDVVRFQTWYEVPHLGKRLYDLRYFPHYNPNQEVDSVVSCISDITDIKDLETLLDESEVRFKSFMDHIPANVYIKDEDDKHVYFNRQTVEVMGKRYEEMIGKTTHDFFDSDTADKLVLLDKKILEGGTPAISGEWVFHEERGNRYIRDYKFPITLEKGKTLIGGIAFDITELKENEQGLQQALKEIGQLKNRLEKDNVLLRDKLKQLTEETEIIGESAAIQSCLHDAKHVATENTTVLLLGETGTGKELLAQAIHDMSSRKNRTMVKVNCAALPANLIESELFGREKGAYTGAMAQQQGRFETADGSTIFLDEIGDLPLELQSKLLRVLQEGRFERLGSNKTIQVDVRVIAATNRDLDRAMDKGTFRKDLFYRLNVFPITLPPLRKRREDIPLLVWTFIEQFNRSMGKSIERVSEAELDRFKHADWPGNVRELKNTVERSMIISQGPELTVRPDGKHSEYGLETSEDMIALSEVEKNHIVKVLQATKWRVSGKFGAAKILNLKPTTLEARMKKLGIVRPKKLN